MTNRRTKISPKSGRGLGHVTPTIFGSTVGYPSDSLASCRRTIHNMALQRIWSVLCADFVIAILGATERHRCRLRTAAEGPDGIEQWLALESGEV